MLNVFQCLTQEHDFALLAAAAVICVISSLTAFRLFILTRAAPARTQTPWVCLTGLVAGGGGGHVPG